MKNRILWFLILALCLSLCGCGNSKEVDNVQTLIDAIGTVTLESNEAIQAAEEAYLALEEKDQSKVTNHSALTAARTEWELLNQKALEEAYVGEWVHEFHGETYMTLNSDNTVSKFDGSSGTWAYNPKTNCLSTTFSISNQTVTWEIPIVIEDGFIKIIGFNRCLIKKDDYQDSFDKKYTAVKIDKDNYRDYISDPVKVGTHFNPHNNITEDVYILTSNVYDDGLIFIASSSDFKFSILVKYKHYTYTQEWTGSPFYCRLMDGVQPIAIQEDIAGTLYFVRSEYVKNHTMNSDNFSYIEFNNGSSYIVNADFGNQSANSIIRIFEGPIDFDLNNYLS